MIQGNPISVRQEKQFLSPDPYADSTVLVCYIPTCALGLICSFSRRAIQIWSCSFPSFLFFNWGHCFTKWAESRNPDWGVENSEKERATHLHTPEKKVCLTSEDEDNALFFENGHNFSPLLKSPGITYWASLHERLHCTEICLNPSFSHLSAIIFSSSHICQNPTIVWIMEEWQIAFSSPFSRNMLANPGEREKGVTRLSAWTTLQFESRVTFYPNEVRERDRERRKESQKCSHNLVRPHHSESSFIGLNLSDLTFCWHFWHGIDVCLNHHVHMRVSFFWPRRRICHRGATGCRWIGAWWPLASFMTTWPSGCWVWTFLYGRCNRTEEDVRLTGLFSLERPQSTWMAIVGSFTHSPGGDSGPFWRSSCLSKKHNGLFLGPFFSRPSVFDSIGLWLIQSLHYILYKKQSMSRLDWKY